MWCAQRTDQISRLRRTVHSPFSLAAACAGQFWIEKGKVLMKGKKISALLALSLGMSVVFTGCSFSKFTEKLIDIVEPSAAQQSVQSTSVEGELFPNYIVNESIEAPTFTQDLSGTVNVQAGGQTALTVQATVSSGEVSYQWYSNNVNANGGGTLIDGATEATYSPVIPAKAEDAASSAAASDAAAASSSQSSVNTGAEAVIASSGSTDTQESTDNSQTTYYYAVAINTVNGEVNMTTSQTIAVTVWDNMYWAQNADNGGYQYVNRSNGSFPKDTVMNIDGVDYTFNADGYIVDASGNLLDYATGQPVGTTDQAAEQAADQNTEQAADQSTDQSAEQATDQSAEQAADQSTEQTADQNTEQTAENSDGQ